LRDAGEIERVVTSFAQSPNGGLVVTASALSLVHSALILTLAARHKLPAVYPRRSLVLAGGLVSYGDVAVGQGALRPDTSTASSELQSLPICRCRHRPSTSW